jgi:hypothetical protein
MVVKKYVPVSVYAGQVLLDPDHAWNGPALPRAAPGVYVVIPPVARFTSTKTVTDVPSVE